MTVLSALGKIRWASCASMTASTPAVPQGVALQIGHRRPSLSGQFKTGHLWTPQIRSSARLVDNAGARIRVRHEARVHLVVDLAGADAPPLPVVEGPPQLAADAEPASLFARSPEGLSGVDSRCPP